MAASRSILCLLMASVFYGCGGATEKKPEKKGIIHKTTQDVGKFDPEAKQLVVSDQKANATDPITGPLSVYGPAVENIAKMKIKMEIETFNAAEGRYPKDYEEFMEKIIKGRDIHLPVLPYKGRYQYDEATRELVIVRDEEDARKSGQEIPAADGQTSQTSEKAD
jgi:hypothetical protein